MPPAARSGGLPSGGPWRNLLSTRPARSEGACARRWRRASYRRECGSSSRWRRRLVLDGGQAGFDDGGRRYRQRHFTVDTRAPTGGSPGTSRANLDGLATVFDCSASRRSRLAGLDRCASRRSKTQRDGPRPPWHRASSSNAVHPFAFQASRDEPAHGDGATVAERTYGPPMAPTQRLDARAFAVEAIDKVAVRRRGRSTDYAAYSVAGQLPGGCRRALLSPRRHLGSRPFFSLAPSADQHVSFRTSSALAPAEG